MCTSCDTALGMEKPKAPTSTGTAAWFVNVKAIPRRLAFFAPGFR